MEFLIEYTQEWKNLNKPGERKTPTGAVWACKGRFNSALIIKQT